MAAISFKSVGRTAETRTTEEVETSPIPIGIKTPLREGSAGEGIWSMNFELADQVHDNLRNLILTNWGERLGSFNFGANLRELTTELVSQENFDSEAVLRIRDAVSQWMPYVTLQDYISQVRHGQQEKTGIIDFTITYDIPMLNVSNKALRVTLYVI